MLNRKFAIYRLHKTETIKRKKESNGRGAKEHKGKKKQTFRTKAKQFDTLFLQKVETNQQIIDLLYLDIRPLIDRWQSLRRYNLQQFPQKYAIGKTAVSQRETFNGESNGAKMRVAPISENL